ncbi:MAG: YdcF family protein [Candidatus Rokubacteria bacterium]|nr:YdcF family protein [Candidatus Rokubacteria bacterium]
MTMSGAGLTGRDVLCVSSIDWDFIWQGHQQIMSTLAAHGNRVLFIENTGVRAPRFGDLARLRHRLARWWKSTNGFRQERENLVVYSPLIVPLPYSRVARWVNRVLLLRALRRWARATGFGRPVAWTFLPTPLARDLLWGLDPELTIYYCIDDLASSSLQARRIEAPERRVFAEVDLVFVTSEKLRQRAAEFSPRVHLFPFAVDYAKFAAVRDGGEAVPPDLAALPAPRIGYVGGLHQWVDQTLLVETARRMPDASFVLVGPRQCDVTALEACPNIHLLGGREHARLPAYLKGFDVGIVPYRLSEYTANVYPTKLNEYLAMGLPVVASDLPEIRRFNAEHGDVVGVGADPESFTGALWRALEKSPPAEVERRTAIARANSWDVRIDRMSDLITGELENRRQREGHGWEDRLRRFYRRTRWRVTRLAVPLALVYAILFWSPLPWLVARPLRVEMAPGPADAIVVFAGGVGESGHGGQGYQDRVEKAVELYRAGFARHLVFSTGWTYTFHEADLMKALALSLGIPADAIVLEKRAGSTYENVVFSAEILRSRGWKRALVVSSPYHMRRAMLTLHRNAPDIEAIPVPARSQFFGHGMGAEWEQIRAIVHEYLGLALYRVEGRI